MKEDEGEDGLDGVDDAVVRVQHRPEDGGDCGRASESAGMQEGRAKLDEPKRHSVMSSSIAGSSRAQVFFVSASGQLGQDTAEERA